MSSFGDDLNCDTLNVRLINGTPVDSGGISVPTFDKVLQASNNSTLENCTFNKNVSVTTIKGTSTQMVTVDSTGLLNSQAIPEIPTVISTLSDLTKEKSESENTINAKSGFKINNEGTTIFETDASNTIICKQLNTDQQATRIVVVDKDGKLGDDKLPIDATFPVVTSNSSKESLNLPSIDNVSTTKSLCIITDTATDNKSKGYIVGQTQNTVEETMDMYTNGDFYCKKKVNINQNKSTSTDASYCHVERIEIVYNWDNNNPPTDVGKSRLVVVDLIGYEKIESTSLPDRIYNKIKTDYRVRSRIKKIGEGPDEEPVFPNPSTNNTMNAIAKITVICDNVGSPADNGFLDSNSHQLPIVVNTTPFTDSQNYVDYTEFTIVRVPIKTDSDFFKFLVGVQVVFEFVELLGEYTS